MNMKSTVKASINPFAQVWGFQLLKFNPSLASLSILTCKRNVLHKKKKSVRKIMKLEIASYPKKGA